VKNKKNCGGTNNPRIKGGGERLERRQSITYEKKQKKVKIQKRKSGASWESRGGEMKAEGSGGADNHKQNWTSGRT